MDHPKRPKFRPGAIDKLFEYAGSKYFGTFDEPKFFLLRYSLICEKFRKKASEDNYDKAVGIPIILTAASSGNDSDSTESSSSFEDKTAEEKFDLLLVFIKLFEYSTLTLEFSDECLPHEKLDKEFIRHFARFCRKLNETKSVQQIQADFSDPSIQKPCISIFIDLLPPNKRLLIKTSNDVSSIMSKREIPLELVCICNLTLDKCTAQMFKINTKGLNITKKQKSITHTLKLHHLGQIGPFSPNSTLKHMAINVDLLNTEFVPKISENEEVKKYITCEEWFENFVPCCRKSLEYLKEINEDLELVLECDEKVDVKTLEGSIACHKIQLQKASHIISMAHNLGLKVNYFKVNTVFDMENTPADEVEETMKSFCEETKLTVGTYMDDEKPVNYYHYGETQIELKIEFTCEDFRYCDLIRKLESFAL